MTRFIIDGNSYLNTKLLGGTDHDDGRKVVDAEGKVHQVNGAQHGVDGFMEKWAEDLKYFGLAPRDTIIAWDGPNAKARRRAFHPRYKEGRDKVPEVNEQLNKARDIVTAIALSVGAAVAQQPGMEADDVIGYFAKALGKSGERVIVGTGDGDLSVLVDENTDVWRLGKLNENPYGPFPHRFITVYKALVGDSKDKIPGAARFGDGKFVDMVRIFGIDCLPMMEELILNGKLATLKEDLAEFKHLQLIIDSKDDVALSWLLASLHVDDVNTMRKPLQLQAGLALPWAMLADNQRHDALAQFYATRTLVHAGNYEEVKRRLVARLDESPFFALDIETSESDESAEYREAVSKAMEKEVKLDQLGHELTGMSITFGDNTQHTIYMTVDHSGADGVANITVDQCREMCEVLPQSKQIVIHNRSFEFQVLYRTWGQVWANNGWGGFVPNAVDTVVGASYVDENLPKGLKERSKHHLRYTQTTYEEVTQKAGKVGTLSGGRVKKVYPVLVSEAVMGPHPKSTPEKPKPDVVVTPAVYDDHEVREYRMNELPASDVLVYGCDDTMTAAALHTHFKLVMDLEGTWGVYMEVEQRPQYLTSLAYVQGVKLSLAKLRDMEQRDNERYDTGWRLLREYLLAKGWEGTVCPEFEGELEASDVKLAASILMPDQEFTTKKRKLNGLAVDLREQFPDNAIADLLAGFADSGDVEGINKLVRQYFTGEPHINFGSPKQMQNLFYNVLGMTPRVFNPLTEKQREDPEMSKAWRRLRQWRDGKITDADVTPEERAIWVSKASTDDDLVEFSLARDNLSDNAKKVLKAYQSVRSVMTRRGLFYRTYKAIPHWRTGRIHPSMNQAHAVTRRYSSSNPNAQQLPKRDEGAEFRQIIVPHHPDAVIVSCDFSGQELRLMAHLSGDANLTACYVGDDKKDVHSLTAVAASIYLWDAPVAYSDFVPMLESTDKEVKGKAKELRNDAKTVNFGTQYDMMAAALAIKLKVDEDLAQKFIDAKDAAMPGIGIWKNEVKSKVEKIGFATTLMGARRHLRDVLMSENRWERSKADRQGPNFEIQGSGAEQSKLAMGEMWDRRLFLGRYNAQFIFPVHDECVASVHRDDALPFIKEFHECMTRAYGGMTVPIVSSISIGANFGEQIECGDEFDADTITAALNKIFNKETAAA